MSIPPAPEVTKCEAPLRQLFVAVERGAARLRLRLFPVQPGGERAAAVNLGLGVVAVEFAGEGDPQSLTEAYHIFRKLRLPDSAAADEDRLSDVFAAWRGALAAAGIALRLERPALYGLPLPPNDWRADPRGISLRPWDVELTAIEAGLRRIVKLDQVPPEFVGTLRQNAEQRGLQVGIVEPRTSAEVASEAKQFATILVARDEPTLVAARGLEQLLLVRGGAPGAAAAALEMGDLLGYPRCCVQRFTRIAGQNDTTLAWALLPGLPCAPASPLTQWLQPGLWLLSHFPCDVNCSPSLALGQRLVDAIESGEPGFALRWRSFAARVQVVDAWRNRMAVAVDGDLAAGARVTAADVLASGGSDPHALDRARRLVSTDVRVQDGGLVSEVHDWYAPYVADHRGA